MNSGIIYLIQPAELINTGRYKVGMSYSDTLDRCKNGYLRGSRYICIMECVNPLDVERKIIQQFTQRFKVIAGREYFEGEKSELLRLFFEIVMASKCGIIENNVEEDNVDIEEDNVDIEVEDDINDDYVNFINGRYVCTICNNDFRTEYLYINHRNKKIPCIEEYEVYLDEEIKTMENIIKEKDKCINANKKICIYCKGEFSIKSTLKTHLLTACKKRKDYVNKLQQYYAELDRILQIKNK
jgi:hypothetical protein